MDPAELLKEFCAAVERRDGKAFAGLFTEDGVYHDVFYGAFEGRQKIAEMIDDWFHRTARDFRWEMFRPVSDGRTLYAYYTFSYVSTLPEAKGRRVGWLRAASAGAAWAGPAALAATAVLRAWITLVSVSCS